MVGSQTEKAKSRGVNKGGASRAMVLVGPAWWGLELSGGSGLTPRAADAALPRANVGGFSAKNHSPTMLVGRRRRAADAIVGRWGLW